MLVKLLDSVDRLIAGLGNAVSWACLAMVLLQAAAVMLRYVFSIGLIAVQEAVVYCHALIFLLASASILQSNGHVRVDIIYGMIGDRARRIVDVVGLAAFVLPMTITILVTAWPYVMRAWDSLEGSRQAGGLPAIYLLKTAILVFAVTVAIQAVAIILRLCLKLPDQHWPGRGEADSGHGG